MTTKMLRRLSLAVCAGFLLTACPSPRAEQAAGEGMSEAAGDMPEATAEALWSYLEDNDFKSWSMWPGKNEFYTGTEPHGMLLTTYVNDKAMEELGDAKIDDELPRGSIIVKENYKPNKELAATTVMYKAAEGYNPEHNDWFFLKRLADGTVEKQGKVKGCQDCHGKSQNDYLLTPLPR